MAEEFILPAPQKSIDDYNGVYPQSSRMAILIFTFTGQMSMYVADTCVLHRLIMTILKLQVVREIHAHHEQRRSELREQHGVIYEYFENVYTQLNNLSAELQLLTEHGVALDANFSKFGYDAHLSNASSNLISDLLVLTVIIRNERTGFECQLD